MALTRQSRLGLRLMQLCRSPQLPSAFMLPIGHSRLESSYDRLDGALAQGAWSTFNSHNHSGLSISKGYNLHISLREFSSGLLRHNAGHAYDQLYSVKAKRTYAMQVKAPPQFRQGSGLKLSIASPGLILEPYKRPEPISFLKRLFTIRGWKRSKEDLISEFKTAYAIAKLRQLTKYSKPKFYEEAIQLYKKINSLLAKGDRTSLRQLVTENMYTIFKREIKQRETTWSRVHWEMIEPAVKVRTLRARMIAVDKNNLDNAFVQITLEILTNQKFAAYDLKGSLITEDSKLLVQDIWVFERSLFQQGARWRLCGRISF